MNRHFKDAWYHVKRAGDDFARGMRTERHRTERRLRRLTGREREPEPSRLASIRGRVVAVERRAESTARRTADEARSKIRMVR